MKKSHPYVEEWDFLIDEKKITYRARQPFSIQQPCQYVPM